jgi:4-hydroxybenzoyl-CoA thioesterase
MAAVTFRMRRSLSWGHCDPAGIIFYPTYYRWMDAATWSLLAECGWPGDRMRAENLSIPLLDSQCSFLASPRFGDEIEVRSTLERVGRSSFALRHEFFLLGAEEKLLARGLESRVWARYEAGPGTTLRSTPVPDALRAALGAPPA